MEWYAIGLCLYYYYYVYMHSCLRMLSLQILGEIKSSTNTHIPPAYYCLANVLSFDPVCNVFFIAAAFTLRYNI